MHMYQNIGTLKISPYNYINVQNIAIGIGANVRMHTLFRHDSILCVTFSFQFIHGS